VGSREDFFYETGFAFNGGPLTGQPKAHNKAIGPGTVPGELAYLTQRSSHVKRFYIFLQLGKIIKRFMSLDK
jgi:hypothetical protein